ncbi:hypothetical protein BJX64DRAFT_20484 [Aspergillus heterothallicus]
MDSSEAGGANSTDMSNVARLLQLPTELLLSVFQFLHPVRKHVFALTCRRLRFMFAELCPELDLDNRHEVRVDLARDGFAFHHCAYCSGCHSIHMLKFFSPQQLEQPPANRLCSASSNQIWAEPRKHYSFEDFQGMKRSFIPKAVPDKLPEPNCSTIMKLFLESWVWKYTDPRENMWSNSPEQFAFCASYDILTLPDSKEATKAEMVRILQGFDIPTCPHTRLGDAIVSKSYVPARHCVPEPVEKVAVWVGKIETQGKDAQCQFPGCKTVYRWSCSSNPRIEGWKTISIYIKRYLGTLLSPVNPRWMAQASMIPDQGRLEDYWKTCHEWKDVNMEIEKQRYERELRNQGSPHRRAEGFELEQLRRENDFLRHPHRGEKFPRPTLDYPAQYRDTKLPSDELPTTTVLLKETERGESAFYTSSYIGKDSPSTHSEDTSNAISTFDPDEDLLLPQCNAEDVLKSIDCHARFDNLFDDFQAIGPWERGIQRFIWGGSDCLTYGNGLFGMMGVPYYVLAPKIRWMSDQLYRLPRSVKRSIMEYEETENRISY